MHRNLQTVRANWELLAGSTRATIVAALLVRVESELARIDTFYPASAFDKPTLEVIGVGEEGGVRRVHFIAHHLNYNNAQSGSDWADHYVFVGSAILEGDAISATELKLEVHDGLTERGYENYERRPVVQRVLDETIVQLSLAKEQSRTR